MRDATFAVSHSEKYAGQPARELTGPLGVKPLAERDRGALELLFARIDQRIENAVRFLSGGSNRGEAFGHKGEIVDLAQIFSDRF